MGKRKPTTYRTIRGIRDDEIRHAFQQLAQQHNMLQVRIQELRALLAFAFPEQVEDFTREVKRRETAAEMQKLAAETLAAIPVCTSCHGVGYFEYTRGDGEVFTESCHCAANTHLEEALVTSAEDTQ